MKTLYRVQITGSIKGFNPCYVVADDPTEAYEKVRKMLDDNQWGYEGDRNLHSIETVAVANKYSNRNVLIV